MPVDTQHREYTNNLIRWAVGRDCVKGQDAIKAKKETYLPKPNAADTSTENSKRYEQYLQRATYVNFTGRTSNSLNGAIFRKDLVLELPNQIDYMETDTDGGGLTIEQLSKMLCRDALEVGRIGILVDYPAVSENATLETTRDIKARLAQYPTETIINWKTEKKNGKTYLAQVVLCEQIEVELDQFATETAKQYRVLSLKGGVYYQDIYNEELDLIDPDIMPRMSDGNPWSEIPFVFIGAEENNSDVDCAPLYDLAQVNIGHYRNSADYEEGVFIHGQGTLSVSSEMSNDQFKAANPDGIMVGARAGHFLGPNGSMDLLQMEANSAAREAMLDKQDQMIAIGARLITSKSSNETAEAARISASSETSILSTIVDNVSSGVTQALKFTCRFMGADEESVEFQLNKEFFDKTLDPQMVMALIQLADRGDIAKTDIRHELRKADFFKEGRTDEEIDSEAEVSPIL